MTEAPFKPSMLNPSVNLAVTATSAGVTLTGDNMDGGHQLTARIINTGANLCYLAWSNVASPTASTTTGMLLPVGVVEKFTFPAAGGVVYLAAICAASQTAQLNITPGEGD